MEIYATFSFLASIVNSVLLFHVYFKNPRGRLNRIYSIFVISLLIWAIGEFLMRTVETREQALFWDRISGIGYLTMVAFFFHFILVFTKQDNILKKKITPYLIYIPAFLFVIIHLTSTLITVDVTKEFFGYTVVFGPVYLYFIIWLEALFLFSFYLLIKYYRTTKEQLIKKQTFLILVATLIPWFIGSITDAFLPMFFDIPFISLAVTFTGINAIIIGYSISRYQLMALTSMTAAETIISTIVDSLILIDKNNNIKQANDATNELLGYIKSELVGYPIDKILDKSEKVFTGPLYGKLMQQGYLKDYNANLITHEGAKIPVNFSAGVVSEASNEIVGIVIVAKDMRKINKLITQLEESQKGLAEKVDERTQELKRTKELYENLVESSDDTIYSIDKLGRIVFVSKSIFSMFGYRVNEVIGRSMRKFITIKDLSRVLSLMKKAFTGMEPIKNFQFDMKHKSGRLMPVEVNSFPLRRKGKIVNFMGIIRDISERRRIEKMKTEFVSVASHQLRTPLSAVKGYIEALLEGDRGKINDEQKEYLQDAYASNKRMIKLVNDLLDVSRIEAGKVKVEPKNISLISLTKELINELCHFSEAHNCRVFIESDKDLPKVHVDPTRIRQVILNLLTNAIKYSQGQGKVVINFSVMDADKIIIPSELAKGLSGKQILVKIIDDGIGIPQDQKNQVFSKFFRADNAIPVSTEGSGLGLYITKAIVDSSGGRIWYDSKEGHGTTFYFTLPIN